MVGGGGGDVTGSEGESGDVLGTSGESFEDKLGGNGKDLGSVDVSVVVEALDMHLVLERSNLELVEEGGLSGGDLITFSDNLHGVNDFDLGLNNLGLDVQGLEEGSLFRVETSGSCGHSHITGGDGADFGWGLSNLGVKNLLDVGQVAVGENHTSVEVELVDDLLEMGASNPLLLCLGISWLFHNCEDCFLEEGLYTN